MTSYAATIGSNISVSLLHKRIDIFQEPEEEDPGERNPNPSLQCTIDPKDGITFLNGATPDILTYGIYDVTGGCVAVFGDEESFIDFLFTLSGEYQLRFTTASYDLVGYIYL